MEHKHNNCNTDCNGTIDCVDSNRNEDADNSKQEESKKKWGITSQGGRFSMRFVALVGVVLSYLLFVNSALQNKYGSINSAEKMMTRRNASSIVKYNDWWTSASNSTAAGRRVEDGNLYRTVQVNQQIIRNVTPAEETKAGGSVASNLATRANVSYSQSMPRTVVKTEEHMTAGSNAAGNEEGASRFRNLRLVFLGDSITRYTYINLAYYLRSGTWMNATGESGKLVVEREFGDWMSFFNHTNTVFQPHEQCDCFRRSSGPLTTDQQLQRKELYENRYYHDFERNVHLTYIQMFPGFPTAGHYNASWETSQPHSLDTEPRPHLWAYNRWSDIIRHHVAKLNPRPDYLVLNAGLWGPGDLGLAEHREDIAAALRESGIVGIYKTTTALRTRIKFKQPLGHETHMCNLLSYCWNLSYTRYFTKANYWDNAHFRAPAYNDMNLELLDVVKEIEQGKFAGSVPPKSSGNASIVERNDHPNIKSSQQPKSVVSTTRATLNTSSNGTVGSVREKPAASVVPKLTTSMKQSDSRPGTYVTKGATSKVELRMPADSMFLQQGKGGKESDSRLHNLSIAYMGDSVTRYSYINLAHYLKFGEWMRGDNERALMVVEKRFGSWMAFMKYTNGLLQPHEQCDCFREDRDLSTPEQVARKTLYENRYYHDFERNVHVTYIQKFGHHDAYGHWNNSETHHQHEFDKQPRPALWSYNTWADTIRHHLGNLDPKPDYLVMNSGLWDTGRLDEPEVRQSVVDALDDTGIVGIYKTTTSWLHHKSPTLLPHESAMCKLLRHCHNVSYTYKFSQRDYWDGKHFRYNVYNRMNSELLEMLGIEAKAGILR